MSLLDTLKKKKLVEFMPCNCRDCIKAGKEGYWAFKNDYISDIIEMRKGHVEREFMLHLIRIGKGE